ncbi:MAG TPA: hypothetical protein VFD05_01555 [Bacilli bacterium]|nr:hypothetical protein [Bacilli bacterium]
MKKTSKLLPLLILLMALSACKPRESSSKPTPEPSTSVVESTSDVDPTSTVEEPSEEETSIPVSTEPDTEIPTSDEPSVSEPVTSEEPPESSEEPPESSEEPPVTSEEPPVSSEEPPSSEPEPEPELPPAIELGDALDAVANPGTAYLEVNAEKVEITESEVEDEVYTVRYVATTADLDDLVLYFKHPEAETGKRYVVSFEINVGVLFDATINGKVYSLIRGDNSIEFSYEEGDGPSLVIKFAAGEELIKSNRAIISELAFREVVYDKVEDLTIDGDLSDWENLRAYENPLVLRGDQPDTEHKSFVIYGAVTDAGIYLAAEVYHDIYKAGGGLWWQESNFEFFIAGNNQYWVSARNGGEKSGNVTEAMMVTTEIEEDGMANYHTLVEVFVANDKLPPGGVIEGQARVGFAWKTDGDNITGGEAAGGGYDPYWVPKGTWVNNADQTYVTYNGIFLENQVIIDLDPEFLTVDGDLSDWEELDAYKTNNVYLEGTGDTSHKNVRFMAVWTEEGLYVAAIAHHDVFIDDDGTWHMNTNLEFFVNGGNQFFVAANGAVANGEGAVVSKAYDGEANFETVIEAFVPAAFFPEGDMLRVGFAWKTNGDVMTGGGGSDGGPDAWWFAAGHWPSNAQEQYYVTADGVFVDNPIVVPA